jgi:hypothetical protein
MLKERGFVLFLMICSFVTLATSCFIYFYFVSPNDEINLTALQGIQNVTSAGNKTAIETLIDWQGQGTISWGLGFLAAITVFFTILIALRRGEADEVSKDPVRTKDDRCIFGRIDNSLPNSECLFDFRTVALLSYCCYTTKSLAKCDKHSGSKRLAV